MTEKLIGLIDCDSFFVSCERAVNPDLNGRPVVVTTGERGCVVSRSKEAKALGVKMGVPVFMDKREHSGIIYIRGNKPLYARLSKRVMEIVKSYSPVVEVSSIDEAYIDLTGMERLYKAPPEEIAQKIRLEIAEKTKIPVSVGLGSSKTLAKLACDKSKKSGGILYISESARTEALKNTQVEELCGVGKAAARALKMLGIFTAADLVSAPDAMIKRAAGRTAAEIKYELSGLSVRPVEAQAKAPKSVQDTAALDDFSQDLHALKQALRRHAHQACRRLRRYNGYCSVIGVMLRTKDFRIFEARERLLRATNGEEDVFNAAVPLLEKLFDSHLIYRSTGIMLENLDYEVQANLFENAPHRDDPLDRAIDALEEKFGENIIKRGGF